MTATPSTHQPSGASFNRGASRQDYRTPDDFRDAVIKRFGMPEIDLAGDESNKFGRTVITKEDDSLLVDWSLFTHTLLFLNPPFGDIAPWVKKCAEATEAGSKKDWGVHILFLVPASVGANWWREWVHHKALVHFLSPRLSFDGKHPFPKDIALIEYWAGHLNEGYDCWRWRP
jgi:phage N-6-adenine-methyltransferase